jgi:hypothetical protein
MGLIRDALIGIALYEAVNYVLKKKSTALADVGGGSSDPIDYSRIASQEEFRPLEPSTEPLITSHLNDGLAAGVNPEAPLTGTGSADGSRDTWKDSLANDELRAPDS